MAKIGYARVSSTDQNPDRQLELLSNCDKIFTDKLSGKDTNREAFQKMMNFIREDDIVVVTELKRLGRNNKELMETMNLIQLKKATLEVLNLPALTGITDDDPRLQLAFKLFLEGSTDKEVEQQIGINRRTFRRYRMKYGITNEVRQKQIDEK